MSILQHYCDDPSCNKPEMRSLLLLCPCGTMEYCGRSCQRRHWKVHKSSHFEAINVTNKKKQIAANEAKDFPTESFIQHTNASWDDSPEVRGLLIDILKAYTEDKYEGLMIYTKNVPAPYGYGKYYPFRFIGNGDHAHSEVTHYIAKEVPGIEVEHTHCCKLESRAKSFLSEYKYRSIELPPELYVKFCSDVMNRTFWFRIDGEKQYDLRSRKFLCRGHIAPVSWDGTLDVLNSAVSAGGWGAMCLINPKSIPSFYVKVKTVYVGPKKQLTKLRLWIWMISWLVLGLLKIKPNNKKEKKRDRHLL